jgi:hypothetical protein
MEDVLQGLLCPIFLMYLAQSFRDEAITAVTVKMPVLWDVTPCSQALHPRKIKEYANFHPQTRGFVE